MGTVPETMRFQMMRAILIVGLGSATFLHAQTAYDGPDAAATRLNYQIHCRGCHSPTGAGAGSVPQLEGHMGTFLNSQQGREFLVRVPGAATSALGDADLAEVLNWMILEFGGASVPEDFQPYTADEVGRLRSAPLNEIINYRSQVLAAINATPPTPAKNTTRD